MSRIAFADEHGVAEDTRCYSIGAIAIAKSGLQEFNRTFADLKLVHGVSRDVCWHDVDNEPGLVNFAIEWTHRIASSNLARIDTIVVDTQRYRKWTEQNANREDAFYRTYTYLLRHLAAQLREPMEILIDDRSDSYDKHDEVLETIGNRMLAQLHSTGRLENVRRVASADHPGVQLADLFTGAIGTVHRMFLDSTLPVGQDQRLAINSMARMLGWDALHYDTMPNSHFNIWHFPIEYRSYPATRAVRCALRPEFVGRDALTDRK